LWYIECVVELVLRTPRLVLRPVEAADSGALYPYVSDPELPRFMSWEAHRDPSETEAWIAVAQEGQARGTDLTWAITFQGPLVGMIGLHDITRQFRAWRVDRAELGFWMAPAFQNRGFVTEASREVVRFGFEALKLHKIIVGCVAENVRSRRVIDKIGFRLIGEQKEHFFRYSRWWSHLAYEMCVDEWRAVLSLTPS